MDNLIDMILRCLTPFAVGFVIGVILRGRLNIQERIKDLREQIRAGIGGPL